jgi:hypothetical protein
LDKKLAAAILGVSDADATDLEIVEEQYEGEVFKITSFFLNRAFIPKLARAKIQRLKKLQDAYFQLKGLVSEDFIFTTRDFDFRRFNTIEELIVGEQSAEMKLKLVLSNAQNPSSAALALDEWSQMLIQYAERFTTLFPNKELEAPQVATTLMVDYGELLSEVKKEKYDGLAIQEYARLRNMI